MGPFVTFPEMKNLFLIRLGLLLGAGAVWSGCSGAGDVKTDRRIEGAWKSNRALTMATVKFQGKPLLLENQQRMGDIFGWMVLKFDGAYLSVEMPPKDGRPAWRFRSSYRVVESEWDSLTYVAKDLLMEAPKVTQVHFVGRNRFWMALGKNGWGDSREYFDRIAEKAPDARR